MSKMPRASNDMEHLMDELEEGLRKTPSVGSAEKGHWVRGAQRLERRYLAKPVEPNSMTRSSDFARSTNFHSTLIPV